jgi:hypothetical protein
VIANATKSRATVTHHRGSPDIATCPRTELELHSETDALPYAAFFSCARIFAHRAFCAAAIFLRAEADIVRLPGAKPVAFAMTVGCDPPRTFAHRAFCASAILCREAADIIRFGWVILLDAAVPIPFKDSIPEMI